MTGSTKSTTQTDMGPWKPAQGALTDIIGKAQTVGGNSDLFKPVAGQQTQDSWKMIEDYARSGPNATQQAMTPVVQGSTGQGFSAGLGQLVSSANGNFLDPSKNPALMEFVNRSNDITANKVNQQFSGAGRYGGNGANTAALTNAVGGNTNAIMMDQYNRERANQMGASNTLFGGGFQGANLAPTLDQANIGNAQLLNQVGGMRDANQTGNNRADLAALEWQKGMIAPIGAMGQNGTQVQTQSSSNPFGSILGGAMTLGGLASGPIGAGLSSALGLGGLTSAAPFSMGFASPMQRA